MGKSTISMTIFNSYASLPEVGIPTVFKRVFFVGMSQGWGTEQSD